jgi:hypothetical protein
MGEIDEDFNGAADTALEVVSGRESVVGFGRRDMLPVEARRREALRARRTGA